MAKCKTCGASVGCSCQLTNGMCAYCSKAVQKAAQKTKNVAAKLN